MLQMAAAATNLVDTDDFSRINKEMIAYDEQRERVIKDSRGVVLSSVIASRQSRRRPARDR